MCGIVGIASLVAGDTPESSRLEQMCASIRHRGPDEEGLVIDGPVGLGARRLSIIDLDAAHQPLRNEDDTVRAVYNGEFYNYRELRRELQKDGHTFRSQGDGEVAVHLYERDGESFVDRLNGMFALAIHDVHRGELLLVRDRLGIKPLFYFHDARYFVFGSEVKALLASGLVPRSLDARGLSQFLAWEYVPAPLTMFQGVRKLPPGCRLRLQLASGQVQVEEYWDLQRHVTQLRSGVLPKSEGEWMEAIDAKIRSAVRGQLASDVPLGAFLSGGVDSSLVVACMGKAKTFTIGIADRSYDEQHWARRVAETLETDHHAETVEPDVVELFDRLMHFMDDPIGDFSIFPTYLVCRLARQQVKVSLTGDGGDELFGGYETYVAQQASAAWERLPQWTRRGVIEPCLSLLRPRRQKKGWVNMAKRFVEGCAHDRRLGHARWRMFVGEPAQRQLLTPDLNRNNLPVDDHILELARQSSGLDPLHQALYIDLKSYLSDNCLVKMDRMSMACSLEARVPLLDHELVELAFCVPPKLKVRRGRTKLLLKRIAARYAPRDCVYRPKQGFSVPIKTWLGGAFRSLMDELLSPRRIEADGIFQPATVQRLKREHLAGQANHSHVLWSLMVFQDWQTRWKV